MRILQRAGVLAGLWLGLLAAQGSAQSGRSWMNGLVLDESETHGVGGALVELIGASDAPQVRGKHLQTAVGADGKYDFPRVPYGSYRFRVSAPGFKTYEIELYVASDALTALHVLLK